VTPRPLHALALLVTLLVCVLSTPPVSHPHAEATAFRPEAEATTLTIERRFDASDRESGRYQYVPFEVPKGTTGLRIALRYDKAAGTNVIDLGLFEPGPLDLGTAAFRGWSGGTRDVVEIGEHHATPGYRIGPLPEGTWHVALGLYKVSAEGTDVTLDITLGTAADDQPEEPSGSAARQDQVAAKASGSTLRQHQPADPSGQTAPQDLRWWSGDLHVHTEHSDGAFSVREVARRAADAGLDFIVITDHNNTVHVRDRGGIDRPLLIAGEEVTTPGGHANVWGLPEGEWIDFRVLPGDPRVAQLAERAHALGALFSINHPFETCDQCDWTHGIPERLDAIEVWNRGAGPQREALALWERLLASGKRVTAVASSDWHRPPAPIGHGSVRVRASALAERPLLVAIRAGAVILMRDPASPPPDVQAEAGGRTAGVGETLRVEPGAMARITVRVERFTSPGLDPCPGACAVELYWNGEQAHVTKIPPTGEVVFPVPPGPGRLRVQVTSAGTIVALTNPIWISLE
jgi:hypothetical protein